MQVGEITEPKIDQAGPAPNGEFTYVDISSVDNNSKRIVEPKRLPADSAPSRARQGLRTGDVLVSMTRPNLNAVALVPPELDGAIGSTGFHVLRARDGVLPQWLYYGVQTRQFVGAMSELVQGALYPAVRPKDIRAFVMPLPALDEQRRVVAEIEKQFSRLDEGVANLKRVKTNLERLCASVYQAAVEGALVVEPNKGDRGSHARAESAEALLARLSELHRTTWKGRGKYRAPENLPIDSLPPIPAGWVWATWGQIGHSQNGRAFPSSEYIDGGCVCCARATCIRQARSSGTRAIRGTFPRGTPPPTLT
jgi:type I restriction enzyme S subunit